MRPCWPMQPVRILSRLVLVRTLKGLRYFASPKVHAVGWYVGSRLQHRWRHCGRRVGDGGGRDIQARWGNRADTRQDKHAYTHICIFDWADNTRWVHSWASHVSPYRFPRPPSFCLESWANGVCVTRCLAAGLYHGSFVKASGGIRDLEATKAMVRATMQLAQLRPPTASSPHEDEGSAVLNVAHPVFLPAHSGA